MWRNLSAALLAAVASGCAVSPVVDPKETLLPRAQAGDKEAQYQLGKAYCCGYGVGYDTQTALAWLCKAGVQGHAGAQYELGRYYGWRSDSYFHTNTPEDRIHAYMWYSLAALQDVHLAAAERDALANDMTAAQLVTAKEHLRDWQNLGCR